MCGRILPVDGHFARSRNDVRKGIAIFRQPLELHTWHLRAELNGGCVGGVTLALSPNGHLQRDHTGMVSTLVAPPSITT